MHLVNFYYADDQTAAAVSIFKSRKLAKLAGVTLAIARFLSTGCKS